MCFDACIQCWLQQSFDWSFDWRLASPEDSRLCMVRKQLKCLQLWYPWLHRLIPMLRKPKHALPVHGLQCACANRLWLRCHGSVGVMKAVEDYEALAKDPDVDIVYVSNIHPAHKDASILMMNHGKHVLCEKPLAVSPRSLHLCWFDQKALSA